MQSVGNSSGSLGGTSDVFVTGPSGVAALDTPQLSQTKLEIRGIVAEIAELSSTQLPQAEFLNAVLPRICSAMGASAAAVWHNQAAGQSQLVGQFRLPDILLPELLSTDQAAEQVSPEQLNHGKILGCVAAEGSPVLVPPKSVRITSGRPANPLDECLIIVPIKIDDRFEMLLEVIQPASGGPAAQRGYLRFVAQMADLMSDYLRRNRLRQLTDESAYVKTLQATLLAISGATEQTAKYQNAATGLSQLLQAELVLIARRRRIVGWPIGYRVCAVSNLPAFDSRSEVVTAAERLLVSRKANEASNSARFTLVATEELTSADANEANEVTVHARCAQNLRELLACSHLGQLRLDASGDCIVLLAFDQSSELSIARQRALDLAKSFESLLCLAPALPNAEQSADAEQSIAQPRHSTWRSWRLRWQPTIMRVAVALSLLAIALFPVPDNISAVAVLESNDKTLYYAPSSAIVDEVCVVTHQAVRTGQPLIKLVDSQLQSRLDELVSQEASTAEQLKNDEGLRKQGKQSDKDERQLSHRIQQSKISLTAIRDQIGIVQTQIDQLTIVARRDAMVTSWDAHNQLRGRPVSAGQLLLATHQPSAQWQLRLSIPERQLGRLRDAMASSREGLFVQFSLTSHPSEVRHGRLVNVSQQLIKDDDGFAKAMGIVAVDGNSLPTKSDGAVARATIACGRTYAGWLAIRDAYREASAWWRLNW